jgi:hypothetical protein
MLIPPGRKPAAKIVEGREGSMMSTVIRCFFALALMTWSGVAMAAQTGAASFAGALLDPNGEAVTHLDQIGAVITMKSAANGQVYSVKVGASGEFNMKLPEGSYDLRVPITTALLQPFEQKGVVVKAGAPLRMDITLPWGINLGTIGDDGTQKANELRARSKFVDGPTPHLADGRPDLSGIWYNIGAGRPPTPPMKPWALDMQAQMRKILAGGPGTQGAGSYCLPQTATPTTITHGYKFVQGQSEIVQLTEALADGWRQIFMDGRPHPAAEDWNPAWYGHSIGRWDGDTLVIDTVGFNESTPGYGVHSEKLHVVERINRPTVGKLKIAVSADDADAWTGPVSWTIEAGLVTGDELQESICNENNAYLVPRDGLGWRARP